MNYIDIKQTKNRFYCRTPLMDKWKRIKEDTYRDYRLGYFGLTYLGKQRITTINADSQIDRIERI